MLACWKCKDIKNCLPELSRNKSVDNFFVQTSLSPDNLSAQTFFMVILTAFILLYVRPRSYACLFPWCVCILQFINIKNDKKEILAVYLYVLVERTLIFCSLVSHMHLEPPSWHLKWRQWLKFQLQWHVTVSMHSGVNH